MRQFPKGQHPQPATLQQLRIATQVASMDSSVAVTAVRYDQDRKKFMGVTNTERELRNDPDVVEIYCNGCPIHNTDARYNWLSDKR